ncbi:hypothetical protein [Mycobacterium paragordonae]|uniref:hypothetical protein n=1 Tax=Mycobacterium paragordonae TaxID=1389713 RepID=UPI0012E21B03|nr:hypothetical protein [Mycobacterium paragordonae]
MTHPKNRLKLTEIDERRRELLLAAQNPKTAQRCDQALEQAHLNWWGWELTGNDDEPNPAA